MSRYGRLLLLALVLAGCQKTMMAKPGGTDAEFRLQSYECQRDTDMRGRAYMNPWLARGVQQDCLEAHGWRVAE
jgi:hypothetical protein